MEKVQTTVAQYGFPEQEENQLKTYILLYKRE